MPLSGLAVIPLQRGDDPTPRIGLVEGTVVRATSVTRAPPCMAASSIFRTALIKQQLRNPSRSPVEIRTGTRNSPTVSCGGRSSESTGGYWYHFETDALPTRPCPGCLSYFRIRASRLLRGLRRCSAAPPLAEHHRKDGRLDSIIEGQTAADLYTAAIERGLLSRLDHPASRRREFA